jgi:CTP synthase
LGFQVAVIEYARNVLGLQDANSTELNPDTLHPVVMNMPEISTTQMGGTMRLGSRKTIFKGESMVRKLYGNVDDVDERHRHRYEVNPSYVEQFESHGLKFVGRDEKGERMIVFELGTGFFCGVQYHPEFKTRPLKPSPVFLGFVMACIGGGLLEGYLAGSVEGDGGVGMRRYHSTVFNEGVVE